MRKLGALLVLVAAAAAEDDLAVLRVGVKAIGVPGVPGPLSLLGEDAFPVVTAKAGGQPVPIVAAARFGKGRVVAFGHGGYLGKTLEEADTGRLLVNSVRWAARAKKRPRIGVHKQPFLLGYIKKQAFDGQDVGDLNTLRGLDVLVAPTHQLNPAQMKSLRSFVRKGGGLITANLGWGWRQLNPGKDLATEHSGNRLFGPMGIVWAGGYITVPKDKRIAVEAPPPRFVHAGRALDALMADEARSPLAVYTLSRCIPELAPDDKLLLPRLEKLRGKNVALPQTKRPLTDKTALARVVLALDIHQNRTLPPKQIRAHPAAEHFPGAVARSAPRVTRKISIEANVPGWHSTGLYAPPGGLVTVKLDADAAARGLALRIGAHKDLLWTKKAWRRAPEVTRRFPLAAMKTLGANAFGGPVYIEVPRGSVLKTVTVEITGAVEAPHFVLGKTAPAEWKKKIRGRPGPWAELGTSKVILTVPSRVVRDLEDPTPLLLFWDEVMDACADLAARSRERRRPERYVTDEQISAGYMHAGYPIMTHLDAAPRFVDLKKLREKGDWGMFHEMGHNHQSGDWTFGGTGEVTCNLFTVYVLENVCTNAIGHKATSADATKNWIDKHKAGGSDFAQWKKSPFLALVMYRQLKEAFGWEPYKKVFAEYRALPGADRPKTDAAKRDQWMVRFSRTIGRNLGPFFESWGIPTTEKARKSIEDLPVWMPDSQARK